jgi:hypothetical protein
VLDEDALLDWQRWITDKIAHLLITTEILQFARPFFAHFVIAIIS